MIGGAVSQIGAWAEFCSDVLGFGRVNVTTVTEDMSMRWFTGDLYGQGGEGQLAAAIYVGSHEGML